MKPIAGHALLYEGRVWNGGPRNGAGRGQCECGGLSPDLPSTAARQRWHKDHKRQVIATAAAVRQRLKREAKA